MKAEKPRTRADVHLRRMDRQALDALIEPLLPWSVVVGVWIAVAESALRTRPGPASALVCTLVSVL
jgi:hypothetical protein